MAPAYHLFECQRFEGFYARIDGWLSSTPDLCGDAYKNVSAETSTDRAPRNFYLAICLSKNSPISANASFVSGALSSRR